MKLSRILKSITPEVVALALAAAPAWAQKGTATPAKPQLSAEAAKVRQEIRARAEKLAAASSTARTSQPMKYSPSSELEKLSADLEAWSKKYNVPLETKTMELQAARAAGGIGGGGLHPCPIIVEGPPGRICVLDPTRSGPTKCVYRCDKY